jgi:predicted SAM-dependent methyltransferase
MRPLARIRTWVRWGPRKAQIVLTSRIAEVTESRRYERATTRRSSEAYARMRSQRGLLLNVGASGHHLDGWVSLDLRPDERGIRLDATRPWPLPDGCARAIRSEHMIEHFTWDEAKAFAGEAARVLEPGGLLRTCTPDLEQVARAYLERDPRVLRAHHGHGYVAPTWAHLVDNYARMWGHRFLFDFDALAGLLAAAAFVEIERAAFGESRHPELAGTDGHDPGELRELVLYVDATKPAQAP